jgi:hypothetical protein
MIDCRNVGVASVIAGGVVAGGVAIGFFCRAAGRVYGASQLVLKHTDRIEQFGEVGWKAVKATKKAAKWANIAAAWSSSMVMWCGIAAIATVAVTLAGVSAYSLYRGRAQHAHSV